MTNLYRILKSRDITWPTKVHIVKAISSNPPEQDFYNMVKGKVGFPGGASGKEPAC